MRVTVQGGIYIERKKERYPEKLEGANQSFSYRVTPLDGEPNFTPLFLSGISADDICVLMHSLLQAAARQLLRVITGKYDVVFSTHLVTLQFTR